MLLSDESDGSGLAKTFPQKLMELLSYDDVKESIAWTPKGEAVMIVDEHSFLEEVLPKFFKKTKFSSFKGKLYRWGFKRVVKGENSGAYFHKLFLRDNPSLCLHMRRIVKKGRVFSIDAPQMEEKILLKNEISLINNVSKSRYSNQATAKVDIHQTKKPLPTIPKLPHLSYSPDSQIACSLENYDRTPLFNVLLTKELLCKEIASRIQMQAQSIEKIMCTSQIPQSSVNELSFASQKLDVFPPMMNVLLSQMSLNQKRSSYDDKRYIEAAAGLLNLQNDSL